MGEKGRGRMKKEGGETMKPDRAKLTDLRKGKLVNS